VTSHATDAMEVHYSTAQPGEKRDVVVKVVINTARSRQGGRATRLGNWLGNLALDPPVQVMSLCKSS
jgi:hypothetical protein